MSDASESTLTHPILGQPDPDPGFTSDAPPNDFDLPGSPARSARDLEPPPPDPFSPPGPIEGGYSAWSIGHNRCSGTTALLYLKRPEMGEVLDLTYVYHADGTPTTPGETLICAHCQVEVSPEELSVDNENWTQPPPMAVTLSAGEGEPDPPSELPSPFDVPTPPPPPPMAYGPYP